MVHVYYTFVEIITDSVIVSTERTFGCCLFTNYITHTCSYKNAVCKFRRSVLNFSIQPNSYKIITIICSINIYGHWLQLIYASFSSVVSSRFQSRFIILILRNSNSNHLFEENTKRFDETIIITLATLTIQI